MPEVDPKKGYDLWGEDYQAAWPESFEKDRVLNVLGKIEGQKILDAGCGVGRNTIKLVKRGAEVTGVDFSDKMLDICKEKLEERDLEAELVNSDLKELPFEEEAFDIVVCSSVIDHIRDLSDVFSEFSRVLKENGILVVSGVHPSVKAEKHAARFEKGEKFFIIKEFDHSFEELQSVARNNGLEKKEMIEIKLGEEQKRFYPEDVFQEEKGKNTYMILKYVKR